MDNKTFQKILGDTIIDNTPEWIEIGRRRSIPKEICEDLLQDTYIKVFCSNKLNKYKSMGKLSGYIYRVYSNLLYDYLRQKSTINKGSNNLIDFSSPELYNYTINNIIKDEEQKEDLLLIPSHILYKAILLLPEEQQVVLISRINGASFKTISEIYNCNLNTSLGRYRYAIINLRKKLIKYL